MSIQTRDLQIAFGTLILLFLLAPFFPQGANYGFAFLFRSMIFLLFAVAVARLGWEEVFARVRSNLLTWPALVGLMWMGIGLGYTESLYHGKAKFALYLTIVLLYFLLLLYPFSQRAWNGLCAGLAAGALLAAVHALWSQWQGHGALIESLRQNLVYDEQMQQEMIRSLEANRALGRFGNPNHLAGYLALGLWPMWYLAQQAEWKKYRWAFAAAALVIIAAIYQTYSRSGLLALIAGITLLVFLHGNVARKVFRPRVLIPIGGLILAGGIAFFLIGPGALLGGRLLTVSTIVARVHFFRGALLIFREYPWFGVGPEGFEAHYPEHLRPGDLEARYVHNLVLESAVEGGLVGLLLLGWLIAAAVWMVLRFLKNNPDQRSLFIAAVGSAATFIILSLVDFHNNMPEMWLAPVLFLGMMGHKTIEIGVRHAVPNSPPQLGEGLGVGLKAEDSTGPINPLPASPNLGEELRGKPNSTVGGSGGGSIKIIGIVLTIGLVFAWGLLVFVRYLNETARELASIHMLEKHPSEAIVKYERAVLYDGADAESWNGMGRAWMEIQSPAALVNWLEAMRQASELAPRRPGFHADYAEALFALGYKERALEEMKTAQRLFPARPLYYERLANLYRQLGMQDRAEEQEKTAQRLKEEIEAKRP